MIPCGNLGHLIWVCHSSHKSKHYPFLPVCTVFWGAQTPLLPWGCTVFLGAQTQFLPVCTVFWGAQTPFLPVCTVFLCAQTMVWLPVLGIFNVHTEVQHASAALSTAHTESWLWEKNTFMSRGVKTCVSGTPGPMLNWPSHIPAQMLVILLYIHLICSSYHMRMYLWEFMYLALIYMHARWELLTVGDSGLCCCCTCVVYSER